MHLVLPPPLAGGAAFACVLYLFSGVFVSPPPVTGAVAVVSASGDPIPTTGFPFSPLLGVPPGYILASQGGGASLRSRIFDCYCSCSG